MNLKQYSELVSKLNDYSDTYYNEGYSEISDYEFDNILKQIKLFEDENPELILEDSPTQKVGYETKSGFKKVAHEIPMLSLDNTYNTEDLQRFIRRTEKEGLPCSYTVEEKIDGVAISLLYEGGELQQALSRGNGEIGENIIHNIKTIKDIPQTIKKKEHFLVRGEIYMSHEAFLDLNRRRAVQGQELFANPRNATAGSLKLLDSSVTASRRLNSFMYSIEIGAQGYKYYDDIFLLKKLGFKTNNTIHVCNNLEDIIKSIEEIEKKRNFLKYDIDGAVIKVNEYSIRNELGISKKAPKWAVSYKYSPERKKTKLLSIDYQVGRTGAITPVANLEPVLLAGSKISRASLHNFDEVKRLEVMVGDIVFVEKGGDVIPKISGVELEERDKSATNLLPIVVPKNCPVCNGAVKKLEGYAKHYCSNDMCSAKLKGRLMHFTSKNAMNIIGFGEKVANLVVDKKLVKNLPDIYRLKIEDFTSIDGWGEKSSSQLIDAIKESKKQPFESVLFALGIERIGQRTAYLFAVRFNNIDNILNLTPSDIIQIENMGEIDAKAIISNLHKTQTVEDINKFKKIGLNFISIEKNHSIIKNKLNNKNFLITGALSKSRGHFEDLILKNGGKISSSVSKNLDFLIYGDKAGSKLDKAAKLSIKIISEEEFLLMLK